MIHVLFSYRSGALANRRNLELCLRYNLAGFTDNLNGLWIFTEIQEGDFVFFLYGARIFNLCKVEKKKAFKIRQTWDHGKRLPSDRVE
ncbi:MAG: hypothetical protein ABDK94_06160, partial [Atribacterota bacterium]